MRAIVPGVRLHRLVESIPGPLKPLQIRALLSLSIELHLFFSFLPSSTHSYLWVGTLFFAFLFVLAVKSLLISFATFSTLVCSQKPFTYVQNLGTNVYRSTAFNKMNVKVKT